MHVTHPHLQLIVEASLLLTSRGLARVIATMHAGVDSIQIRERGATACQILRAAERLLVPASETATAIIINDRADVALALRSTVPAAPNGSRVPVGVHLGGHSLPVTVIRHRSLSLAGVSVHSFDEARSAARDGADYITFGHVFPSSSHPDLPPQGLNLLADVVAAVEIPVLAIGGIDVTNVSDVIATGCAGIAVISAILDAPDPVLATRNLRAVLDRAASPERSLS